MPKRTLAKSSASAIAMGFEARRPSERTDIVGDAASPAALARLEAAIAELRALSVTPFLRQGLECIRAEDPKAASDWALKALNLDPRSGMAWYVLAVAREKAGDFDSSLKAYESALALLPDQSELANDLGRLAYRMGMTAIAEQLFRRYLDVHPESCWAANNLACALRDQDRRDEAIEVLKGSIKADPDQALLWNTLGTVVERGDIGGSIVFFDEALRLEPKFAKARYNRGNARLALEQLEDALVDCDEAMAAAECEEDRLMMQFARGSIQLCRGRLGEGWDDYEARLEPRFANAPRFLIDRPRWTPDVDLAGKALLLVGEQGLGDEVLFANVVEDVLAALGPTGRLVLAVEPRLVTLFARSFPSADVRPHATARAHGLTLRGVPSLRKEEQIDFWAPLASPLRRFRRTHESFPNRERFLTPEPSRVEHWRRTLESAPAGPKVGLLWKSMKLDGTRARYFSPFQLWSQVLKTPGVSFVNVQYGDCRAELEEAKRELGVEIWQPPGIDLKDDLDDVAALTCALDLTLGFANATSNIAAACGAPTWIISAPAAWTRLGTARMPWYPQARVFVPEAFGRWEPVLAEVAAALAEFSGKA